MDSGQSKSYNIVKHSGTMGSLKGMFGITLPPD